MNANEAMLLLAEGVLGMYLLLPWTDADSKKYVLGILGGLIAGHLNGRSAAKQRQASV